MSQLCDVSNSTTKKINVTHHVSDPNSGETLAEVRDWKPYIEKRFKKLLNITKYQNFRFFFEYTGFVFCERASIVSTRK